MVKFGYLSRKFSAVNLKSLCWSNIDLYFSSFPVSSTIFVGHGDSLSGIGPTKWENDGNYGLWLVGHANVIDPLTLLLLLLLLILIRWKTLLKMGAFRFCCRVSCIKLIQWNASFRLKTAIFRQCAVRQI